MSRKNSAPTSHTALISDVRLFLDEAGEWRTQAFSRDAVYEGLFAIASVVVATVLSVILSTVTDTITQMFYVAAVVATALYAGPKAALMALVVSVPVSIYFVISHSQGFGVTKSEDAVRLIVYVLVSVPIVVLAHMRRRFDEKYRRVERQLALARAELRKIEERDAASAEIAPISKGSRRVVTADGLEIDFAMRAAFRSDSPISLTRTEWSILEYLAANAGRVLTVAELEQNIFGGERSDSGQHLRNCVLRLRRKVEIDASNPRAIVTVHGFGYKLSVPPGSPTLAERDLIEADGFAGARDSNVIAASS